MRDNTSWVLSAFLTAGFVIAAGVTTGALAVGWLLLAIGMGAVTWVRYRAVHQPPD